MTPSQAYAQWKGVGANPNESESQTIRRFSQQFRLKPEEEEELLGAYPDRPQFARSWDDTGRREKESGFLSQTFGAGFDELQKSAGSAIAGPGAETLSDFGWEGGAGFLEDIGTDIVKQQEEDLQAYEAPQTRDQLIEEGGIWGNVYEHLLPEETQTPQQLGRSALPSLGAAGIALGAAGVTALATGGNPWAVGAVAMAVGNAVGSFQVGGEEFENAKRDPFIRQQLGINPNAKFADLLPDQQRALTDSAQRVAKDTMVERVYQGGALESLAFIPYGPLALRYIADIALGATSEEMDKRLGMENTIEELERLGVQREEIPELREKMKALRPGTFETVWNAAIMEATFGAPTALIETAAQTDSRVDRRLTAASERRKILQDRIKKAVADPLKLEKARMDLQKLDLQMVHLQENQDAKAQKEVDRKYDTERRERIKTTKDARKTAERAEDLTAESLTSATMAHAESTPEIPSWMSLLQANPDKKTTSSSRSAVGDPDVNQMLGNEVANGSVVEDGSDILSMDRIVHQTAINELNKAFPEIDFRAGKLGKDVDGNTSLFYESMDGEIGQDINWRGTEGFVEDLTDSQYEGRNPTVYLTQRMFDNGQLITNTEQSLDRMAEVAFHEALGHAGLRKLLNAGTIKTAIQTDENGKRTEVVDESMEWTGEEYNQFIKDFDQRHKKMVDRWLKSGRYANVARFRQVEEFIASNLGESGGGKTLGYFDNMAIAIREANPFIKNSLNQYQVAQKIQQVADKYATGLEGKAPKKGNLLTGVELMGAISRAATEAKIPEEARTEEAVTLKYDERKKAQLQLTEDAGKSRRGVEGLDQEPEVRSKEKPLTEKQIKTRTKLVNQQLQRATGEKTSLALLRKLAGNTNPEIRKLVAKNKRTPEDALKILERDNIEGVREAVAGRRKADKKVTKEADDIRKANIKAKEDKKTAKVKLKKDTVKKMNTAASLKATPEKLTELSKDESKDVRAKVAQNDSTPDTVLKSLAKDTEPYVAGLALSKINYRAKGKAWEKSKADTAKEREKTKAKKAKESAKKKIATSKGVIEQSEKKIKQLTEDKKKILTTPKSKRNKADTNKLAGIPERIKMEKGRVATAKGTIKSLSKSDARTEEGALEGTVQAEGAEGFAKDAIQQKLGMVYQKFAFNQIPIWATDTYVDVETEQLEPTLTSKEFPRRKNESDKAYMKRFRKEADKRIGTIEQIKDAEGNVQKAKSWERYEMGVRLPDEEAQFLPDLRTKALFYQIRRNLASDEIADLDLAMEGIAKAQSEIELFNEMLSDTGEGALKPIGRKGVRLKILEERGKIKRFEKHAIEAKRNVERKITNALKTLPDDQKESFEAFIGLHDEFGQLSKIEVARTILPKYAGNKMKLGDDPSKYLKRIEVKAGELIDKAVTTLAGKAGLDLLPEDSEAIDALGDYARSLGYPMGAEGTVVRDLNKEALKKKKTIRKLWKELKPFNKKKPTDKEGRLSFANVKGDEELKAERRLKAKQLYMDHSIVAQTFAADKENVQKNWGVLQEDLDWAKENGWQMEARPYVEPKTSMAGAQFEFLQKEAQAKKEKEFVDSWLDETSKPTTFKKMSEADQNLVREWVTSNKASLTKSEVNLADHHLTRSIVPFTPVSAVTKFNKLQNWVYSLFGPTRNSLEYTRKALKRSRADKTKALPANRHKKFTLPNGSVFYVGKNKTTDQWIEQVEGVLSDEEILNAKDWYPQIIPIFEKTFGKKDAPKMVMAWALANKGESPLGAMRNILKVGQNLKNYLKQEFVKKGGLAHDNIVKVLREEMVTGGAGVKLFDFLDASVGMDFRSVAGFDASMGAPAVVDRHTWRDFGYIDDVVLKYLRTALPKNKTLKNLVVDRKVPSVTDTEYEIVADWFRKMADDLNAKNWKGRSDWKPRDVQAVGWMGITETLPSEGGGTPGQMISETSRTLAFEIDFGAGSPLSKKFGKDFNNDKVVSPEERQRITYEVGDLIADIALKRTGVKETERIRGYGYYEKTGNPNIILKIGATDPAVADIMDVIGLLAQQTEVIAFGPKNKARGVGFDFKDNENKLQDKDIQQKFYLGLREAFPNYVLGASQTTIDGKAGLRVVLSNATAKTGNAKKIAQNVSELGNKIATEMQSTINKLAEDLGLDLQLDIFQAETFYANNDWTNKESKNGELYKQRINTRFRPTVSGGIINNDTARVEQKISAGIARAKAKTEGARRKEAKKLEIPSTFLTNKEGLHKSSWKSPRVSKSQAAPINISRSNQTINSNSLYGRWTNFWLRQIKKVKPLSKLKGRVEYLKLRQIAFGQMTQWQVFSKSVFNALRDSKQTKEVYKYLTTPNANSSIITNPVERVAAEKAKSAIEKIGQTLVARKLMKASTLEKFKAEHGDYLPRVYLRHLLDDADHTKIAMGLKPSSLDYLKNRRDIPQGVRELILGELSDQHGAPALLASRALMVPGKDLAIMGWMQKMKDMSFQQDLGWVLKNQFVKFNTLEEAKKIAKGVPNGQAVIRELEMDVDLSEMSAEVTPAWLAAESTKLGIMAKNLQGSRKEIVDKLRIKMMDIAKSKEEVVGTGVGIEGFRQMPDSARYGPLRGMWIHKQIADDIIGGMKIATGDESTWEKWVGETGKVGQYNSYWKWAKVAANPPSWARNFISNNVLLTLAGVPFWSIPKLNLAAINELRTKGKYYQVALRQGVMAGNMTEAELGRMETDFKQIQIKMGEGNNKMDWIKLMFGKTMDAGSSLYGGLETLGKIAAIKYAMEKQGMNEADAASFANKWLFDYGLVTPSVRYASTAVVGAPFIRFQANAIPLMFEVMLTKPWRMVPYYALAYGFVEAFKDNHDLDEEQYEAAKKALSDWLQEKAMGGLLPPNILPLPALDDQGRMQVYDLSYLMPWGMISEVSGELWNKEFASALQSVGLMGGPVADILAAFKTGQDSFTRRPITDDSKPFAEQFTDWLWYAINMSTPSMFHSEHGAFTRVVQTAMGDLDPKTGRPKYTTFQASVKAIGQNIYPVDLVESRKTNIRRLKWEIGNLKSDWRKLLRGLTKSKASKDDIQEARTEFNERLAEKLKERRDYVKASKVPRSLRAS